MASVGKQRVFEAREKGGAILKQGNKLVRKEMVSATDGEGGGVRVEGRRRKPAAPSFPTKSSAACGPRETCTAPTSNGPPPSDCHQPQRCHHLHQPTALRSSPPEPTPPRWRQTSSESEWNHSLVPSPGARLHGCLDGEARLQEVILLSADDDDVTSSAAFGAPVVQLVREGEDVANVPSEREDLQMGSEWLDCLYARDL